VSVALTEAQPKLMTAAAQQLGVVEQISTFTTYHPCCAARVTNIHKIADIVGGHVVLPGETFSLNGLVGERDKARGFVEAPMIQDGLYVDSVGGGVSQFATTIFNAVFFAGLQDVQHKPHSYWISRYPAGRESTVSFPEPDFKFKNDSPNGVLIQTSYTNTSLTVTFWGTKRYDIESISGPRVNVKPFTTRYNPKPGCESASGREGFDIDVWRVFKQGGKELKREKFFTRYLPEPHIICGAKPSGTPAPTPSTSGTPAPLASTPPPTPGDN
jgi:vancomycin resistance protein YoaR